MQMDYGTARAPHGLEVKYLPFNGQALAAESGEVQGYASLFGEADQGGDVVAPGAFLASLAAKEAWLSLPLALAVLALVRGRLRAAAVPLASLCAAVCLYLALRDSVSFHIVGSEGDIFEPNQVVKARARLGDHGLDIRMLPGGHMITSEQPERFARIIEEVGPSIAAV